MLYLPKGNCNIVAVIYINNKNMLREVSMKGVERGLQYLDRRCLINKEGFGLDLDLDSNVLTPSTTHSMPG